MPAGLSLDALPFRLRWLRPPEDSSVGNGALTIAAGGRTDWFIDPSGKSDPVMNAPAIVGDVDGDFTLSARVTVDFAATFDAGVLTVYGDERTWAKLCFEYSPRGEPMVVSVVTRGSSDDCNSMAVERNEIWLRIARLGPAFAFHASTDGSTWLLIRHFPLDLNKTAAVGFLVQSPLGTGCRATFEPIAFAPTRLADLRSGL